MRHCREVPVDRRPVGAIVVPPRPDDAQRHRTGRRWRSRSSCNGTVVDRGARRVTAGADIDAAKLPAAAVVRRGPIADWPRARLDDRQGRVTCGATDRRPWRHATRPAPAIASTSPAAASTSWSGVASAVRRLDPACPATAGHDRRRPARHRAGRGGLAGTAPVSRDLRVVAAGGPALLLSYSLCITSMRFVVPGERRSGPRSLGSAPRRPRDDPARGAHRPGHRHRAARPQGPGAHRVRPRVDEPEPAARVPDRPRPRPRLRDRGHRRQRVPRLRRRHRRQLDRPQPPRRRRRDPAPGRASSSTSARATSTCRSTPRPPRSWPASRRCAARPARSSATRAPRRSRPGSSSPGTTRSRPNVIAFLGGFHGRTMGAVSLTASKAKYHAHFGPLLPGVYHVPFGNEGLDELERRVFKRLMPGRRVRRRHRRADPGRGRLRRPRGRLPAAPARAVRPPRDPADRRRGPVGRRPHREDVGDPALGRRARHPADGEGHRRPGCRSAR